MGDSTLQQAILALGPVSYWPLDSVNNGEASDLVSDRKLYVAGSLSAGAFTRWPACTGLSFDGFSYLSAPSWDEIRIRGDFTVFALVEKDDGATGVRWVFSVTGTGDNADQNFLVGCRSDGGQMGGFHEFGPGTNVSYSSGDASDFPNAEVAAVFQRDSSEQRYIGYIDEDPIMAGRFSSPSVDRNPTGGDFTQVYIGAGTSGDVTGEWIGRIGHLAVFDYRLTIDQLRTMHKAITDQGGSAVVSGEVTDSDGDPLARDVIGIVRTESAPRLFGSARSSEQNGSYSILGSLQPDEELFLVALDSTGEAYAPGQVEADALVHPTTANGYVYRVVSGGELPTTEPDWWTEGQQLVGTATLEARQYYRPLAHGPVDVTFL